RATKPERCTGFSPAPSSGFAGTVSWPGSSLVVIVLLLVVAGGRVLGGSRAGRDQGGQAFAAARGLLRLQAQSVDLAVGAGDGDPAQRLAQQPAGGVDVVIVDLQSE